MLETKRIIINTGKLFKPTAVSRKGIKSGSTKSASKLQPKNDRINDKIQTNNKTKSFKIKRAISDNRSKEIKLENENSDENDKRISLSKLSKQQLIELLLEKDSQKSMPIPKPRNSVKKWLLSMKIT